VYNYRLARGFRVTLFRFCSPSGNEREPASVKQTAFKKIMEDFQKIFNFILSQLNFFANYAN
jgi:hypothetical protein